MDAPRSEPPQEEEEKELNTSRPYDSDSERMEVEGGVLDQSATSTIFIQSSQEENDQDEEVIHPNNNPPSTLTNILEEEEEVDVNKEEETVTLDPLNEQKSPHHHEEEEEEEEKDKTPPPPAPAEDDERMEVEGVVEDKENVPLPQDKEKEKRSEEEVIDIDSDSSEEGENVGVIRIRDFTSLREIGESSAEEEEEEEKGGGGGKEKDDVVHQVFDVLDDDVVEVPAAPLRTLRVPLDSLSEQIVPLSLQCSSEPFVGSAAKQRERREVRAKLIALRDALKEGGGLNVRGIRVSAPNTSTFNLRGVYSGGTTPGAYTLSTQVNAGAVRMATRPPAFSIIRPRSLAQQQSVTPPQMGVRSAAAPGVVNPPQHVTQLLFDPVSGLLLYPTVSGGTTGGGVVAQPQQQGRNYTQIQTASQLIASMSSGTRTSTTGPTRVTTPRGAAPIYSGGTHVITPSTQSGNYVIQGRRGVVGASPVLPQPPTPRAPFFRVNSLGGGGGVRGATSSTLIPPSNVYMRGGLSVRGRGVAPLVRGANPNPPPPPLFTTAPPQGTTKTVSSAGGGGGGGVLSAATSTMNRVNVAPGTTKKVMGPKGGAASSPPVSTILKLLAPQQQQQQKEKEVVGGGGGGGEEVVTAGTMQPITDIPERESNTKTFPSLVVVIKPCLQDKLTKGAYAAARADLDLRVKTILMYSPSKFTEWLMQKGLLRVDHRCALHPGPSGGGVAYKLGMYSDGGAKQPFSGGYVWISDCCPDKQISVFQGSIFEASVYPPGTLMKLMYHWSCQTPAANTLQWVKVTSYYLKNFYTLLRSACVAGLHQNCPPMGGRGKYIEIGIITLGTTLQSGAAGQKQVKIEILGVFDPASKTIRLKVINPGNNQGVTDVHHDRITQILWPLNAWVDKRSVILIDNSMDKALLEEMGFASVSQTKGPPPGLSKSSTPTNVNVMNYLKNIVPKMFQNTLCVLSKSLIQQFLDELSWREIWGGSPASTFDNIVNHLVQMTKADTGESLICRLNKISLNPFQEWSYSEKTPPTPASLLDCLPDSITGPAAPTTQSLPSSSSEMEGLGQIAANYIRSKQGGGAPSATPIYSQQQQQKSAGVGAKRKSAPPEGPPSTVELQKYLNSQPKLFTLQNYYYVQVAPPLSMINTRGEFPLNLKCPLCSKVFGSNREALRHIAVHVLNVGRSNSNQLICQYCLKELAPGTSLASHINEVHRMAEVANACRICNLKFGGESNLVLHMWEHHVEAEAPYRCDVCDFRSSFHTDVVDHFESDHLGMDCVQCPLCLKVLVTKSFACLKMLVVHLQNHMIKKGKKCADCVLVFPGDGEYRSHVLGDKSHESRPPGTFKRHKLQGYPIGMAKPPKVTKAKLPPPPASKKARASAAPGKGQGAANVTTLNSALAVPINPNEKFTYERANLSVLGLVKDSECWECERDGSLPYHFTGGMKCNKCKYSTLCPMGMTRHSRIHHGVGDAPSASSFPVGPQRPKPKMGERFLCACGFTSKYPDLMANHILECGEKVIVPYSETQEEEDLHPQQVGAGEGEGGVEEEEDEPPPPVLYSQV